MVRKALGVAVAIASGLLACSLSTSLDGLSETPPAPLPDGSATPTAAGGDTTLPRDGSSGGDSAPADAGSYCATVGADAAFCADYEEADLTLAYEHGVLTHVARPEVCTGCGASDDGGGRGSATAFLVQLPAMDGGGSSSKDYFNEPVVVPATAAATLRFDMQILELTQAKEVDFASVHLITASGDELTSYVVADSSGGGDFSIEGSSSFNDTPFTLPADGQWHTYAVTLTGSTAKAALSVDDKPTTSVTLASGAVTVVKATFILGPSAYPPYQPVHIAFDNVVLIPQ
jgi:hypothetical protein